MMLVQAEYGSIRDLSIVCWSRVYSVHLKLVGAWFASRHAYVSHRERNGIGYGNAKLPDAIRSRLGLALRLALELLQQAKPDYYVRAHNGRLDLFQHIIG